jgi:membrane protein DedA with SNARE-associated domain
MISNVGLTLLADIKRFGYLAIFIGVMLESAGVPVPGETILLTGSGLAGQGQLSIFFVVITGIAAAIIGDNLGFAIGRFGGRPLIERFGRFVFIKQKQLDKVDTFFNKYGPVSVFLARFIAGGRVVMALVAGASEMRWTSFLLFNALGAIAWVSIVSVVGFYGLSYGKDYLLPVLRQIPIGIYILIVTVVTIWVVLHLTQKNRD